MSSDRRGVYRFVGRTVEGDRLTGTGMLSHEQADAPVFSRSNGETVPVDDLAIEWKPVTGADSYEVIISDEDEGGSITIELNGDATSVGIPKELLEPGTEYKAEVLAILANGNKTISEGLFHTAP